MLPIEVIRFKEVREGLRFTQSAFATELGIKQSTADIERGRTKIPGHVVKNLLQKFNINPLWLYGDSEQKYLPISRLDSSPKVITVDAQGNENILMVNAKAAAGYPENIQQPEWFDDLPIFSIPLPQFKNASFRAFQIEGDSMLPNLMSNDWILARAVANLDEAHYGMIHVIVLIDSILVKVLYPAEDPETVKLISSNSNYQPITVEKRAIQELWEVNSKLSFDLQGEIHSPLLHQIQSDIADIKHQLNQGKRS